MDAAPDAEQANAEWDEGGGVQLEYQEIFSAAAPGMTLYQARATAFYWKTIMPKEYPFIPNPGCMKTGMATPTDDTDDVFPFGMGKTHSYLNVGTPVITGGSTPLVIPDGPIPGRDGYFRPHDGKWSFFVNNMAGKTYFDKHDALYSLHLSGSGEWPEQLYKDSIYIPPSYTVTNPPFGPTTLVAGQPMVQTWTETVTPKNLPPGVAMSYITGIIVPGVGPVVVCLQDNVAAGTLTIPANLIDYARSIGAAGTMGRAHIVHRIQELTAYGTHDHKRMDFVGIWCYVTPWTAP